MIKRWFAADEDKAVAEEGGFVRGMGYLLFLGFMRDTQYQEFTMTEMALLNMARQIPQSRWQELYDFARFLVEQYANAPNEERIAAFESEDEMIDFINDVGKQVYAD